MNAIAEKFLATTEIDVPHSRIKMGGEEVAYHCDKFGTRIIKGLEDVMGYEKAAELISHSAAVTVTDLLTNFISKQPEWAGLDVAGKLAAIFDIYKLLGAGAFTAEKTDGSSTKVTSKSSYIAEGWLENMARWRWDLRENPVCHDNCGYLRAAFALATGKSIDAITVKETECRAAGKDACVFEVGVK